MNTIKNRVKKLEQNSLINSVENETEDCKTEICEHPPPVLKLYKDYPVTGHLDRRLITKGHCNGCGFDDYLWSFNNLTDEQENRRRELLHASDFRAANAYDLELINAGLIKYALFPPPAEVQMKFTGKVTL